MESTLDRLLRIQGATEQTILDTSSQAGGSPPAEEIEIRQMFTLEAAHALGMMNQAGKIELIDNLIVYKNEGLVYAHFKLYPGRQAAGLEDMPF